MLSSKRVENLRPAIWYEKSCSGDNFPARTGQSCVYDEGTESLYMFGGTEVKGKRNDVFKRNVSGSKGWKKLETFGEVPCPRSGATAVSIGGYMYLFGGAAEGNSKQYLNDLYKFKFDTREWSKIDAANINQNDVPQPRTDHTMVIYNNKLLVFGGFNGKKRFNDIHSFSLSEKKWTLKGRNSDFKPSRRFGHSAVVYGDEMYVFGGWDGNNTLNCLWRFHIDTERWSQVVGPSNQEEEIIDDFGMVRARKPTSIRGKTRILKSIPSTLRRRSSHRKTEFVPMEDDTENVFGIANTNYPHDTSTFWSGWVESRYRHAAIVDSDEACMYIFGGINTNNLMIPDVYKYDFLQSRWGKVLVQGNKGPCSRTFHSCVFISKKSRLLNNGYSHLNLHNIDSRICHSSIIVLAGYDGHKRMNDSFELVLP